MDTKKLFVRLLLFVSIFIGASFALAAPSWLQPELWLMAAGSDIIAPTGSVVINGGAANTNSTAVNLTVSAVDTSGAVQWMSFSNDAISWTATETYAPLKSWNLPAGDGNKAVWARFIDYADNTSTPVSDGIFLDTVAPSPAALTAPPISTNVSKNKTFNVGWGGATDAAPSSGIAAYDVEVKKNSGGAWVAWKTGAPAGAAGFPGVPGNSYYFLARAHDAAGNAGPYSAAARVIVPLDQSKGIVKRVGFAGTVAKAKSPYYLGTVRYSTTGGDEITYSFKGSYFALIGTKGPKLSKAVVTIDGAKKTIDAKAAKNKFRQVLMEKPLAMKKHTVKIKNLGTPGRGRFEIDGLGIGK